MDACVCLCLCVCGMCSVHPINQAGVCVCKCVEAMDISSVEAFVQDAESQFLRHTSTFLKCKVVDCKAATRTSLQLVRQVLGVCIVSDMCVHPRALVRHSVGIGGVGVCSSVFSMLMGIGCVCVCE